VGNHQKEGGIREYLGCQCLSFLGLLQLWVEAVAFVVSPTMQSFRILFGIDKELSLGSRILGGERRYH